MWLCVSLRCILHLLLTLLIYHGYMYHHAKHAAFKVFDGCTRDLLYILLSFQVSERLYRGPEFYYNYLIDYLIDYLINCTIGFIIITS